MDRLRTLFLLLGFTAYLLTGVAQARGLVWCIGAAGESRLEYAPQGSCDGADPCQEAAPAAGLAHEDADHCDSCLDLPVFSETRRTDGRAAVDADTFSTAPLPLPVFTTQSPILLAATTGFRPQPPPPLSSTLRALRTVVLLN